jgi:hypothetical protein
MRKIHKGKIPLFSKRSGLKNGPDNFVSYTVSNAFKLINK